MKPAIKVSVIMITYNQADYIRRAVESVLAQKVPFAYELLIGDDASTDGTADIVRSLAAAFPDRIRLIQQEKNLGASANVLSLLKQSRGEYLAFCEGDDYWLDDEKLAKQTAFLDNHPEYIGCSHACRVVDENGEPLPRQRISWLKPGVKRFTFRHFSGGRFLPGQTSTVVKRNLFLDADEEMLRMMLCDPSISDRVSNEIYLLRGDFCCLEDCWSAYRCVAQKASITTQKYRDKPSVCLAELHVTGEMEKYAAKCTGRSVRFVRKRSEILLVALAYRLLKRNDECKAILKTICRQTKAREVLLLPLALLTKAYSRLFCVKH